MPIGLQQIIIRSQPQRTDGRLEFPVAGEDEHRLFRPLLLGKTKHLKAAHPLHDQVGDNQIIRSSKQRQSLFTAGGRIRCIPMVEHVKPEALADKLLVIND